jgi:hypothetical protein
VRPRRETDIAVRSGDRQSDFGFWRELEAKWRRNLALRPLRRAFRKSKRWLPDYWRLATQRYRQLPTVIIVGAQKAGTTQLHSCLIHHPRCFSGATKEVHYFTKHRDRPLSWYRSQFPLAWSVSRTNGLCLEATPSYLATPEALRRMGDTLPNAQVIVLLRDPVTRAFSHYQHYKSRQLETRTFRRVVRDAIERQEYRPVHGAALAAGAPPLLDYVYRGYYALQLEVLFEQFPRERVLVIDSAELFADSNATCQKVFEFIGVESHDVSPKKIHNRGLYRDVIDPEIAAQLREHYLPYDQLLVELMGRRFGWMDVAATPRVESRPAA